MLKRILSLLALFSVWLVSTQPCAAESDEEIISRKFDQMMIAMQEQKFDSLDDLMHPTALSLFRKRIQVTVEQLMENHPADEVLGLIGIEAMPEECPLSDGGLFVALCQRAMQVKADFGQVEEKYLPVKRHGVVFADNARAFVVFEHRNHAESETSEVSFTNGRTVTFMKFGGDWVVYSAMFTNNLAGLWGKELANMKAVEDKASSEGARNEGGAFSAEDRRGGESAADLEKEGAGN